MRSSLPGRCEVLGADRGVAVEFEGLDQPQPDRVVVIDDQQLAAALGAWLFQLPDSLFSSDQLCELHAGTESPAASPRRRAARMTWVRGDLRRRATA